MRPSIGWRVAAGAGDLLRTDGVLYVYQDPALAEAARDTMAESDRRGAPTRYVTGDQIRDVDPAIPASVACGFHKPEERFVASPIEFTRKIAGGLHRRRRRSRPGRGRPAGGQGGTGAARALP